MAFQVRSAAAVLLVLVFATANLVVKSAGATTYVVGDSLGWTIPPGGAGSYASWASGHTFLPGDVLVFNFPTGVHDVAKVDKASFDSCSASNPTTLATVGPATITLPSTGDQYFICTFGQHCSLGQKLTLKVSGASTTPPAPSPNATAHSPPPTTVATPPPTAVATPPPTATKPLAPPPSSTTSSPPPTAPPTAAASTPKATPSSTPPSATTSSPPTAAPKPATPSTSTTTPPAESPAVTPSSATPPSSTPTPPTTAPAPTTGGFNPGGPEVPATAQSPGGSGPGGVTAGAPGPSDSSHRLPTATATTASPTVVGLIIAIAGGIAFIGY